MAIQAWHNPLTPLGYYLHYGSSLNALTWFEWFYMWVDTVSPLTVVATSATAPTTPVAMNVTGAWFVATHPGLGCQIWFGLYDTGHAWHANNTRIVASRNICYSLSPAGGWSVGVDDPTHATNFFSNAAVLGHAGWSEICWWGTYVNATYTCQFSFVYDDDFLLIVWDYGTDEGQQLNTWNGTGVGTKRGLLICKYTSKYGVSDTYPFVALVGYFGPNHDADYYMFSRRTGGGQNLLGAMWLPDRATYCVPLVDGYVPMSFVGEPNPVNGQFDWEPVLLYTATAGNEHRRGYLDTNVVRFAPSSFGARTRLSGGDSGRDWIVICSGIGTATGPASANSIVVPWDVSKG